MTDDASSGVPSQSGDRHIVSVLFADVISSTRLTAGLDPDDIREIMDHATSVMANAVRSYDGSVVRFQGDGIEAVFGAPRPAEDHALRACLAGLAIQKAFASDPFPADMRIARPSEPLQVRVGIHSGLVIAREMNSDLGRGVDLLGATVSVAALAEKLCRAGAVTATAATVELAGAFLLSVPYKPVGHELAGSYEFVEVTGVDLSAPAIPLRGAAPSDLFVGRIDELQAILRTLDAAAEGGRTVALVGDAGIGKSRLSAEAARSAAARQIPVYQMRGLSLTQATPYAPLSPFIRSLLSIGGEGGDEAIAAAALRLRLTEAESRSVGELLGIETAGKRVAESAAERRARLHEAFCAVTLKALGQRPALLVVDDFHLLDAETVAGLLRLSRRIGESRALFLLNGRPDGVDTMRRMTGQIIELTPLGKSDLLTLVRHLAPEVAGNEELAARIAERSGGVPFVLEQILRSMAREGAAFDDHMLPTNVASIVLARLNRLSAYARHLAQVASIMGEESDYGVLTRVAADRHAEPTNRVQELVDSGFFLPITSGTVRFKHSLIRDACLDSIVRPERRRLHAQILHCFQEQQRALSPHFEQLAYHAEGAGRDDLAIEYLWSACKNAARNSAVDSLALLFERAMACCERRGSAGEQREVDFVLLAFDAMQQHGKLMDVVSRLGRTAELAKSQSRADKECLARTHLATVLWFQARHEEGRKLAERAVALARGFNAPPAFVYAQLTLANLRYGCGDIAGAIELLRSNIDLLSGDLERAQLGAVGIPSVMSRGFLAWYLADLGQFREADQHAARAVAVADGEGRPYSRVLAHLARGRLLYERGDYPAAIPVLGQVRDWCWEHRIYAMEPIVSGLLASALSRGGAAKEGLAVTEASLAKRFDRGAARMACFYLFAGHGEALHGCGESTRGRETVEKVVQQTENPLDRCLSVPGHLLLGQILLGDGEPEAARAAFARALELATGSGMAPAAARANEGLAACCREAPGEDDSRYVEAAAALYGQTDLPVPASLSR